ncbi:MAG: hypothetical protein QM765_38080 [Myxococcales bacterium]
MWLVRLASHEYGLLQKEGEGFAWHAGSRDDMLSTVPDQFFDMATPIAIARDRPDESESATPR